MLEKVNVSVTLNSVICHNQSESTLNPFGSGGSEVYLWPLFFSIDGNGVTITDPPEFLLSGHITVLATQGNHGNLGVDGGVKAGDVLPIPASVGHFTYQAQAIPLPFPCEPLRPEGVHGLVGVATILMEEDLLPDDAIIPGYEALPVVVQSALDNFMNGRSIFAGDPDQNELDAISTQVQDEVTNVIAQHLGLFGIIGAAIDKDDQLLSKIFTFPIQQLQDAGSAQLQAREAHGDDDWEITGLIVASQPCAFAAASKALTQSKEAPLDLSPFQRFRDEQLRARRNLGYWVDLLHRNSTHVALTLLTDATARRAVRDVTAEAARALANLDAPISPALPRQARQLLDSMIKFGSPRARRDFQLLRHVTTQLQGKTGRQAIDLMTRNPPRSSLPPELPHRATGCQ